MMAGVLAPSVMQRTGMILCCLIRCRAADSMLPLCLPSTACMLLLRHALCVQLLDANATSDDGRVSPAIRQTLLHWAYELTQVDFESTAIAMHA